MFNTVVSALAAEAPAPLSRPYTGFLLAWLFRRLPAAPMPLEKRLSKKSASAATTTKCMARLSTRGGDGLL